MHPGNQHERDDHQQIPGPEFRQRHHGPGTGLARIAPGIGKGADVFGEPDEQRYQQEAEQLRAELAEQKKVSLGAAAERDQVRADLAAITAKSEAIEQARQEQRQAAELEAGRAGERLAKAEADQEKAHQEASAAREDAANLRGQVEAMKAQVAELMQVLAANKP